MKKIRVLLVMLVVAFIGLGWTAAAHAQNNFRSGKDVTVLEGQTVDRTLFAAGQTIDIAGTVNGDIFCAGQSVSITGHITGDVICAGQTVHIAGKVDGNVRVAGQTVAVDGAVARSMTVAGQTVTLDASGSVASDATIGAQDATLNGTVGRDLAASATSLTVNGRVDRDTQATVTDLTLGSNASIGGNLTYYSNHSLERQSGAQVAGSISRHELPAQSQNEPRVGALIGGGFLSALYMLVALLVVSLVLVLLMPQFIHGATEVAVRSPWKTLLVGFLASFIGPIVIVALMLTLIGIPLALLALMAWLVIVCISVPFAAYYLGSMLLSKSANNPIWMMLLGTAIIVVLYLIPIVGFIVWLVATWFGLGIILMQFPRLPRPRYVVAEPR